MPTWLRCGGVFVKEKCRSFGYARGTKCVFRFPVSASSWFLLGVSVTRTATHKPPKRLGDMNMRAQRSSSRSSVLFSQLRSTKLQEVSRRKCVPSPRIEIERKISHNCCGALPAIWFSFIRSISIRTHFIPHVDPSKHKEERKTSACWQTLLPDILGQLLRLSPIVPTLPVALPAPRQRSCVVSLRNIERKSKWSR